MVTRDEASVSSSEHHNYHHHQHLSSCHSSHCTGRPLVIYLTAASTSLNWLAVIQLGFLHVNLTTIATAAAAVHVTSCWSSSTFFCCSTTIFGSAFTIAHRLIVELWLKSVPTVALWSLYSTELACANIDLLAMITSPAQLWKSNLLVSTGFFFNHSSLIWSLMKPALNWCSACKNAVMLKAVLSIKLVSLAREHWWCRCWKWQQTAVQISFWEPHFLVDGLLGRANQAVRVQAAIRKALPASPSKAYTLDASEIG